ncbi:MAG: site-specific integrase [Desulfarculus sp.]|nr:site-specific integrase [Desulfarculus sp.]
MAALTQEKIMALVGEWLRHTLQAEEDSRTNRPRPWDEDHLEEHLEFLAVMESDCREALALGKIGGAAQVNVEEIASQHGIEVAPGSPEWRSMAREVLKALVVYCQVEARRSVGDYSEAGLSLAARLPYPAQQDPAVPSIPLGELVGIYVAAKVRHKKWSTERSRQAGEAKLKFFLAVVGEDLGHAQLTKEHLRQVSRALEHIPKSMTMSREYQKLSLPQIMAMKIPDEDKMSPGTLGTYISTINAFLDWLEAKQDNVTPGLAKVLKHTAASDKIEREVVNFTTDDLFNIFHSQEYTRDSFKKPWQFWIPPLLLFTGARLEEICQLNLDDIRLEGDVWVINIIGDPDDALGRHVKNKSSRRLVPLHPFLIDSLNLPGYIAKLRSYKKPRLFSEFEKRSGRYSHYASRWFNEGERAYKRRVGIVDDPYSRKTLHSFRHTFLQTCDLLSIPPRKSQQVTGHKTTRQIAELDQGNDSYKIYTHGLPLETIYQDVMLKLDFGVDLSHLAHSKYVVKGSH